jgi:thioredoxin-like negative regulator of GroEL
MPTPGCIVLAVLAIIVAVLIICIAVLLAVGRPGAPTTVITVQDRPHLEALRRADDGRPLLVFFHTPWCKFCQRMQPQFEAAAAGAPHRCAQMDVHEQPQVVAELALEGFPTVVLFEPGSGEVRAQRAGFCDDKALRRWVESV